MKQLYIRPLVKALLLSAAVVFAVAVFFSTCTHNVTRAGVVISHSTTSDRHGNIKYYTIARFEDGIRSICGVKNYVVRIGDTVYYTERVLNKNK